MRSVRRSRHNVYQIHYHFVTPMKYRWNVFGKPNREHALRNIIKGLEERYDFWFEEIGIDKNHVHWLVGASPKYSPSAIIRVIKSISGKEMFRLCPELREELWGGELWTDGYYVATVGEGGNREVIRSYVSNQGKKIEDSGQVRLFKP